ncbi:aminoglycoside phosphotransferase family protein [uncultured Thiohalocapsa sp.]|uniref:phosphotransferase n=1 Tax=uncultured Thiohalocapsa sp. TaxID=768990 RepID=UPI0025CEDFDF|nr:aminoglycoside phosphotransferase family protein [uncultured Thiohalocapsa sp.]
MHPPTTSSVPGPPRPDHWARLLGPELTVLVASLGSPVRAVAPIGRLVSPASARAAFRIALRDGRELKGRRLESVQRCEALTRIWPLLGDLSFSRGLAHRGAALLEPWIPGEPLTPAQTTSARLAEAGDMLGRLHCLALPARLATGHTPLPERAMRQLERHLGTLASLGLLSRAQTRALLERAAEQWPQRLERGLIHHDFCAENLIVTGQDALWAIDNEDMRVGALDADLARCFLRWQMSIGDREAFLDGYRRHRSDKPYQAHARFWSIWTLAGAAEFRASRRLPANELLAQLRRQPAGPTSVASRPSAPMR